nr:hypothetical protein CKG001_28510 [Bdellovibrio sp. CKG001]
MTAEEVIVIQFDTGAVKHMTERFFPKSEDFIEELFLGITHMMKWDDLIADAWHTSSMKLVPSKYRVQI